MQRLITGLCQLRKIVMIKYLTLFIALFISISFFSCKKVTAATEDCFEGTATTRTIIDKQATVKLSGDVFYLIEDGAIDTRLKPCNLKPEFRVHDLRVTISGMIKSTVNTAVCCTENFVLSKIDR